ncbi:MAG: hypothetical protein AAF628_00950 [Planctomycetota bacterium]
MAKFPLNPLLYLASAGLAAGSGMLFYETMMGPPPPSQKEATDEAFELIKKGRVRQPDELRNDYSEAALPWWKNFTAANLIGKLPPKPVERETVEEPVVTQSVTPLEEILQVILILSDPAGTSKCVVRYLDSANVQPPPDAVASGGAPAGGPRDVVAQRAAAMRQPGRGGPSGGSNTPMPSFGGGTELHHHLEVGEPLWPPYEDIKLAEVLTTGESVVFRREGEVLPEGVAREEKVFHNELQLDKEILEELERNAVAVRRLPEGAGDEPLPREARPSYPAGQWVDVGERTRAVEPGQWHISRSDSQFLQSNAKRVFNEDVSLQSYVSRSGAVSGVRVTKVSAQLERFGVQAGDVLLELNGVAVRNKAEALSVGRKQYRRGTRAFRAKVLNRYGRIEERTYYAPNR